MAKRFKLKLSLSSFQFCRSIQPLSLPQSPSPAAPTYMFSPFNSKSFDIAYPNLPGPPPSTPNFKRHSSKETTTSTSRRKSTLNPCLSDDSDSGTWPVPPQKPEKKKKNKLKGMRASTVCSNCNTSPFESGWFSSDEESESLLSSSMSFGSSYDFGCALETIDEMSINRSKRNNNNNNKKKKKNIKVKKMVEGKVMSESFAVVKRSKDPCEDFKRSMLEMVLEKQMFEANDLEQLLQCFLSLNSRHHHAAIVEAFSEIWELLFSKSL